MKPDHTPREEHRALHDYLARLDSYGMELNIDLSDFLKYMDARAQQLPEGTDARRKDIYTAFGQGSARDVGNNDPEDLRGEREF